MLRRLTIGAIALLLIAVFVIVVGAGDDGRMTEREQNFAGRSVENGATLFAEACAGCHGIQGEGIPGVAPALNAAAFFTTRLDEVGYTGGLRSYVESTVAAGRPVGSGKYSAVMPTWGNQYGGPFRPDQVSDVTSYVLNWEEEAIARGGGEPAEPVATPTPLPPGASPAELGAALFVEKGCAGCHGEPYGAGGGIGPNLGGIAARAATTVAGQGAEEYIQASIVNPNAYVVPECPTGPCAAGLMPQTYGDQLSEQELDALVQYLLTLE